ncbi:hypothetical protein HZB88_04555 [archaeon]|nr:hypothetical protein [archaeon]
MKSALKHIGNFFLGLLLSIIGLIGTLFIIFALIFSFSMIFAQNFPEDSSYINQTIDAYFEEHKEDMLKGIVEIGLQQQMKEIEGGITEEQKAQLKAEGLDCLSGKLEQIEFQGEKINCKELSNQTNIESIKEGIKSNAPQIKRKEVQNSFFLLAGAIYAIGFLLILLSSRFRLRKSLYRIFSKSAVISFLVALLAFGIKMLASSSVAKILPFPFFISFFAQLILMALKPAAERLLPIAFISFIIFLILTIICWKKPHD